MNTTPTTNTKDNNTKDDPYCGPYNPNIIGRLRKPPTDSASLADHLTPTREQDHGNMNANQFYTQNHNKKTKAQRAKNKRPPGNLPPPENNPPAFDAAPDEDP